MTTYDNYKESGIEWLGDIPAHWISKRFKDFTSKIQDGTHFTPIYTDTGINFLSVNDITKKNFNLSKSKYISLEAHKELIKRCKPVKGDLLLSKNGTIGVPFIIDFDTEVSIYVSLCLIKLKSEVHNKYFYYILLSDFMFEQYKINAKTNSVSNLHLDKLANFYSILPNVKEQTTIANYLDTKTQAIDKKIDLLSKKADTYKDLRKSLINETVCRGLDKNVALKDSGIEWIGQIPQHWEVVRIKDFTYVKARIGWQGLRNDEFIDNGNWYCVTGTDFSNGTIDWENCYYVEKDRYDQDTKIQLKINDLLITKDGTIGKIALIKELPKQATLNSGVFVTRPLLKKYKNEFLFWFLQSTSFKNFIDYTKNGSTILHLYQNVFERFSYCLPDLEEQTAIANYLDEKTQKIDAIIINIEKQIEALKELRKTLINDVVTGKIKVTDN